MPNVIELYKNAGQDLKKRMNGYDKVNCDIDYEIYEDLIDCGFIEIIPPQKTPSITMPMTHMHGIQFMICTDSSKNVGSGISIKPGNIILNFKKLMASIPSIIESSVTVANSIPILKVCAALNIFAKLKNAFVIKIAEDQAFVMVALWKNCNSKKEISFDNGFECVKALYAKHKETEITEKKYNEIIDSLEKIKCIKLKDGNIKLTERLRKKYLENT